MTSISGKSVFRNSVSSNHVDRAMVDRAMVDRWSRLAACAADEKKAVEPVILDMSELLSITDAFVIASAPNDRQVKAIADEVERRLKQNGGPSPLRVEGLDEARWILLDYGDFVVHIFLDETRRFYDLERLWADAPRIEWSDERTAANQ